MDEATGGAGVTALESSHRLTERQLLVEIHGMLTAQLPASDGWQPIEKAPKDMTIVVVFTSDSEVLTAFRESGQWYSVREGLKLTGQPTHWMALPEPPK